MRHRGPWGPLCALLVSLSSSGCCWDPPAEAPAPPATPAPMSLSAPSPAPLATRIQVLALDVVRRTPLGEVAVALDDGPPTRVVGGRISLPIAPGTLHRLSLSAPGHLAIRWEGPVTESLSLSARLCPGVLRVVGFGDSITAGLKVAPGDRFIVKVGQQVRLGRTGQEVAFIDRGRSGDTYASALTRLEDDVLWANPDVTLVEFGTNDARRSSLDSFADQVAAVLGPLERFSPIMLVADVPYKPRWAGTWNQQTAPFNQILAQQAARFGAILVPLSRAFRDAADWDLFVHDAPYDLLLPNSQWQGDIHPNAAGNAVIARAVAQAILAATEPSVTPSSR